MNTADSGYSTEAVQAILALAAEQQAQPAEFSYNQLLEMAAELNLSPEALAAAEKQWRQRQQEQERLQMRRQKQWQHLRRHLIPYLTVNAGLIILNIVCSGAITWAVYPLLGWGLGLLGQAAGFGCRSAASRSCT